MVAMTRRRLLTGGLAACAAPLAKAGTEAAQPTQRHLNPVLGRGGVHHVAIRTRDWDRTLEFYRRVLGCHVKLSWNEVLAPMQERLSATAEQPRNQRWAYLDTGDGTCIEVFEDATFTPPPPGTDPTNTPGSPIVHLGIRTSRLDHVWEVARQFSARLGEAPTAYTLHTIDAGPIVVRLGFLQGPSGEWIELIENAP